MKASEILIITPLFVISFMVAETIISHMMLETPFQRFLARVGFQLQLYLLIYLLFDTRDISRRVRKLEEHIGESSAGADEHVPHEVEG